jgi:hypothetical protein
MLPALFYLMRFPGEIRTGTWDRTRYSGVSEGACEQRVLVGKPSNNRRDNRNVIEDGGSDEANACDNISRKHICEKAEVCNWAGIWLRN